MSRPAIDTTTDASIPTIDRAEADAALTDIASRRPDIVGRSPLSGTLAAPAGHRRNALLELATIIDGEDRSPTHTGPISLVLDLIVPPLCAFLVAEDVIDAVNMFGQLVAAVAEKQRYDNAPADYAAAIEWPTRDDALEALDARLQSDIDHWADKLMGATA